MAQVLKQAVRARIEDAALSCFAADGYEGTTMAAIATAAGTATANVYRYFASKQELFATVVPQQLREAHDRLLDARIEALGTAPAAAAAAGELLDFWIAHRLAVVVLLGRAEGTTFADYPAAFVQRLVRHTERLLDGEPSAAQREVLELVFDNTRRAIARILFSGKDSEQIRALVTVFWSYQVPGLDGLVAHLRTNPP